MADSKEHDDSGPIAFGSDELNAVRDLPEEILGDRTLETYGYNWSRFSDSCEENGYQALPANPEVVAAYLSARAEKWTTSTVQGDKKAIAWKHRTTGHEDPTKSQLVSRTMEVIHQRADSDEGNGKRRALLTGDIRRMVDSLSLENPADGGVWAEAMWLRALRNRAMILLGYAGALRASEVAGIRVKDFSFNPEGGEVYLPDPKTTPRTVGVSYADDPRYCAVSSLGTWIEKVGIESGPVFRRIYNSCRLGDHRIDRRTVWRVVKGAAKEANISDPDQVGAHSLRRGHATQAVMNGVPLERLRRHLGHKDPATTAEYVADAKRMQQETSQELGL